MPLFVYYYVILLLFLDEVTARLILSSKMGGKKRSKFDRIYSDNESNSEEESDKEELTLVVGEEEEIELDYEDTGNLNSDQNGKDSNLNNSSNKVADKFLVTRSKRKYKKRELDVNGETNSKQQIGNGKESSIKDRGRVKPKKGGSGNTSFLEELELKDKVKKAKSHLEELNKLIDARNSEIESLKLKSVKPVNVGEITMPSINNVSDGGDHDESKSSTSGNDSDLMCQEFGMEIEETPRRSSKRERSRDRNRSSSSRGRKHQRKSSRSKSRSRSRHRHRSSDERENEDLESHYRSDPLVQEIVKKMVSEQMAAAAKRDGTGNGAEINYSVNKLKSPSDSTLYVPAIDRAQKFEEVYRPISIVDDGTAVAGGDRIRTDKINEMLTQVRLGIADSTLGKTDNKGRAEMSNGSSSRSETQRDKEPVSERRSMAEEAILEAERFKAQIQQPVNKGIQFNNKDLICMQQQNVLKHLRYLDSEDDEFFHTICHIEPAIRERIERGAYVDLEKLIQKRTQYEPSEKRMQLVNRDGHSYFVPYERETKIDGIKKWEQAFRVYTTIYCQANPNRAGEILQYVDVIHRAASIFSWDNVAKYDYVFRQLMAEKPHRSWAKTYTQMWNMTLNEPIKKFQEQGNANNRSAGKKRDNTCWKFNKNNCSYGKNCRFEHKCSYCGSYNHPAIHCPKKKDNKKKNTSSSSSNTQQSTQ